MAHNQKKKGNGVSTKVVRAPPTIMFFWNKPNLPKRKGRIGIMEGEKREGEGRGRGRERPKQRRTFGGAKE